MATISGMFGRVPPVTGEIHTYFADGPVVIKVEGLQWSRDGGAVTSPFTIVRVYVVYNGERVGEFHEDTGGQTTATFDISSALRAIWANEDFRDEVSDALDAYNGVSPAETWVRSYKPYSLEVLTEYLDSQDGEFTQTSSGVIDGGQCAIGGFTEWERYVIPSNADADVSYREHSNLRNGDASTKPTDTPERVGRSSITSWVDVQNSGTQSVFYPATAGDGNGEADSTSAHAPLVLRDSQDYIDFLFVNRRGAVETCSGLTKEAMNIDVESKTYTRVERPAFSPTRSIMAIASGGRRSWPMSSGYVTRDWAEWWTLEFLKGRRHWMLYKGRYVPVTIEPAKKSVSIYDRSKQQPPHVDFTVTLALEG